MHCCEQEAAAVTLCFSILSAPKSDHFYNKLNDWFASFWFTIKHPGK